MPLPLVKSVFASAKLVYALADFAEKSPPGDTLESTYDPENLPDGFLESLTDKLRDRILLGPKNGDRSANDYTVAGQLIRKGFSPGQVLTIFLTSEWKISAKTQERGIGYACRTISSATASGLTSVKVAGVKTSVSFTDLIESLHWGESAKGNDIRKKEVEPDSDFTGPCLDWLKKNGMEFLRDERTGDGYLFWGGRVISAEKDSRELKDFFYAEARVTETAWDSRKLREAVSHEARVHGRDVTLHSWIAFDTRKCVGYMLPDSRKGTVLMFGNGVVTEVPNGHDGYLLKPSYLALPLTFDPTVEKAKGLKMIVDEISTNFACPIAGQQLLTCFMLAIVLQAFASNDLLPILHITGPSDGGKSWGLKIITSWFYGRLLLMQATQASSYQISDADLFIALDDFESLSPEWQGRLLTGATGQVRTKMGAQNTGVVMQEGTVTFALTSINPLPTDTLRRRAAVIEVNSKKHSKPGFNVTTTISDIQEHRDYTWSAFIRLLAEDILPSMVSGSASGNIKRVQDTIEIAQNRSLATFLSLMWLVAEGIEKYVPGFLQKDLKGTMTEWVTFMGLQSIAEFVERAPVVLYVDALFREMKRTGGEYGVLNVDVSPVEDNGECIGFQGTSGAIHTSFGTICKNRGLKYEFSSPNAVGRQFQLTQELLESQGWLAEPITQGSRRGWRVTRANDKSTGTITSSSAAPIPSNGIGPSGNGGASNGHGLS